MARKKQVTIIFHQVKKCPFYSGNVCRQSFVPRLCQELNQYNPDAEPPINCPLDNYNAENNPNLARYDQAAS